MKKFRGRFALYNVFVRETKFKGFMPCQISIDGGKWMNAFCKKSEWRYYDAKFMVENGIISGRWFPQGDIMTMWDSPREFFTEKDGDLIPLPIPTPKSPS